MNARDLAEMAGAYVDCALWAGLDWSAVEDRGVGNPVPLDEGYGPGDVTPAALTAIEAECEAFADANMADLAEVGSWAQHGHDFYLTRNGHGAGFWDRGYGEAGVRLSAAAKACGEAEPDPVGDGTLAAGP